MVMTMTSAQLFIPWSLIYTHPVRGRDLDPDGRNFEWMGFWGLRHIIEHDIRGPGFGESLASTFRGAKITPVGGKVTVGFQADEGIDPEFRGTWVVDQRALFDSLPGAQRNERSTKLAVEQAFREPDFPDQITYFFCHHEGEGPSERPNAGEPGLYLRFCRPNEKDREPIRAYEIARWLDHRSFRKPPLVFINGCGGGHMTTVNYQTLAQTLLRYGALGLLGPRSTCR
jgi:hypothetical protein